MYPASIRGDNCTTLTCQIGGNAYAVKNISSRISCVTGYTCSNFPNQPPKPMPQFNPQDFVAAANNGQIIDCNNFADDIPGDGICAFFGPSTAFLGPAAITGNVYVTNSKSLVVFGPIYITGELRLLTGASIFPDTSLGELGTVIIVANQITINDATINTNSYGGYLLLYAGYSPRPPCSSISYTAGCTIYVQNLRPGSKAILWAGNSLRFGAQSNTSFTGALLSTFQELTFLHNNTVTIDYHPALSKARFFKDNNSPITIIQGSYKIKQ